MKLTKNDRTIIASYESLLEGLADYLGSGYEFVLHSLENLDKSIIKIINGHYSNRTVGAPITDYALSLLHEIEENDVQHKFVTYFNMDDRGTMIKSSTLPIMGENDRIIAMICINYYMNTPISDFIDSMTPSKNKPQRQETFSSDVNSLIFTAVEDARRIVENDPNITFANRNKGIVEILFRKGLFNMKDSVQLVASTLGISKNTVYLHLRGIKK